MESVLVRRKSCLIRIRENCPFRRLRRHTYDVSTAASSAIGSYWNDISPPLNKQPISTVFSHCELLPPPLPSFQSACAPSQSEAAVDVHLDEDAEDLQGRAEICMDMDGGIDPETGESAQE